MSYLIKLYIIYKMKMLHLSLTQTFPYILDKQCLLVPNVTKNTIVWYPVKANIYIKNLFTNYLHINRYIQQSRCMFPSVTGLHPLHGMQQTNQPTASGQCTAPSRPQSSPLQGTEYTSWVYSNVLKHYCLYMNILENSRLLGRVIDLNLLSRWIA